MREKGGGRKEKPLRDAATQAMRPFGCYRIIVINLEFAVYLFCVSNVENSHNVHMQGKKPAIL